MSDTVHVTVVTRLVVQVSAGVRGEAAKEQALAKIRDQYPGLPWSVEHVEIPWGTLRTQLAALRENAEQARLAFKEIEAVSNSAVVRRIANQQRTALASSAPEAPRS